MVASWLAWLYALFQTSIQWLTDMTILGVPVIAFLVAIFVMGVIMSAILYKA